ncbi:MAG: hypothetical protein QOF21_2088 [Actinomycetota bacterium]
MSSLWTPEGEKPVNRPSQPTDAPVDEETLTEEEVAERMDTLRQQIAQTPVEQIVSQAAYQMFEIAALHLSLIPPQLPQAKLAIDTYGLLVEGLEGRLGPDGETLKDGLTQLRLAFVQVSQAGDPSQPPEN